ncbi:zinc-binding dehydrogenase [Stachybotrys elegans]|uniref:alcohol dehydrogenase (NADP(+)) n=1 Tax=Stachybotrys elegans TaxID=80388 RepID=A0A8K0WNH0_9HYPO|nr:zinc-binding dehydrogenase [Stachybotrys elegans]
MATQGYKFEGWLGLDKESIGGKMVWGEFKPKPWEETDVDIKISHCGVCGTDLHVLRSGWRATPYPICVGHEIIGTVVRVGSKAEGGLKVGDRVGVGAQSDSCLGRDSECDDCASGLEQYCGKFVNTYGGKHFNGAKSMGGYGMYHRCPSHFVVKIPDGLDSADAAPMLCGGITLFAPLKDHGCGPGKTVGIVGVGGLGHFGIAFAKALGADRVVGISRSETKRDEVLRMGADSYIATEDEENWANKYGKTFDLIISTVSSSKMPLTQYLGLLKREGTLVQVGIPDDGPLGFNPGVLINLRSKITGSKIGSPAEIRQMLDLAVEKHVKPWVQVRHMSEANQTILDMDAGKARYRYVLANETIQGKL